MTEVLTDALIKEMRPIGLLFPKPKKTAKRPTRGGRLFNRRRVGDKKKTPRKIKNSIKFDKIKRIRQTPLPKLKEKLWELCKEYTKLRDGRLCVSCGKRDGTQCGHFLPKSACNLIYKYHELNLGRQCSYCNLFLKGNYIGYRKHQIEKLGTEMVEIIETEYCNPLPLQFNSRQWVEDKIKWYKNEIIKFKSL